MTDSDVAISDLPPAGVIWCALVQEEKTYHFNEEVADQRRRIELVDSKIREIIRGRGARLSHQEQ